MFMVSCNGKHINLYTIYYSAGFSVSSYLFGSVIRGSCIDLTDITIFGNIRIAKIFISCEVEFFLQSHSAIMLFTENHNRRSVKRSQNFVLMRFS